MLYRPPKGGGTFAKQQGYKVKKLIFTIMFSSCSLNISHGQQHSLQLSQALLIHQERYFKLVGNLLFCLRINPQGKVTTNQFINGCQFPNNQKNNGKGAQCTWYMFVQGDESDPVGVLLMENFTVNPDPMQVCIQEIWCDVGQNCSCTGTPELHSHIQSWGGE